MTDDRPERDEQDPADDDAQETAPESSRPANAAARRERRSAENRPAGRSAKDAKDSKDTKGAKPSKDADRQGGARTTLSGRREERVSPPVRIARFLREVVAELRKVIWPTRKELVTYTIVVLVFLSFMVALVAALDIAFAKGVLWLFG